MKFFQDYVVAEILTGLAKAGLPVLGHQDSVSTGEYPEDMNTSSNEECLVGVVVVEQQGNPKVNLFS